MLTDRRILVGGTEQYGGFFGIPEEAPRSLMIANAGVFTSPADVDRLAEAIEAAASMGEASIVWSDLRITIRALAGKPSYSASVNEESIGG